MVNSLRAAAFAAMCGCVLLLSGCNWFISPEQRIERAQQRIADADDRGALIELQNAVRSEPGNVKARLMLADISLRLGDPKAAEREIASAVQHGATAAQVGELSAQTRIALGEYEQLIGQLDSRGLQLAEPAASTYRGLALLGLSKPEEAVQSFNQALGVDGGAQRARIGLAEALASQGRFDAALQELETVLSADQRSALAWLLKGTTLAKRGDFKPASVALNKAREHAGGQLTASQRVIALAALTETQLASGDVTAAAATHAELAKIAPTYPLTQLLAARLAMVRQDYTTAVAEAQKAVTAAPGLLPAKLLLGTALLAQGNLNQADTQLSEVVRQAPENLEARKLLARVNLQMQRPDIAMQVLAPAQESGSSDPQLDALLGWTNLQQGDHAAAIALLERSVAAQPNNTNLKLDLASAYMSGGFNDKAVELLRALPAAAGTRRDSLLVSALAASKGPDVARAEIERMVAASPADGATLSLAASVYARLGDFGKARELFTRAAAVEPKSATPLLNLARVESAAGDQKAADAAVEKALAVDPANAAAQLAHAQSAVRSGDMNEAVTRLEKIRAANPTAVEPRLLLARVYLRQKKTREVDEVIRELRARAEAEPTVANAVGGLYLDAGRFEEGLSWFRSAAQKDAGNVSYSLNVARTQLALGNNSAAHETLEKILDVHPNSVSASAVLIMLDLREGRREPALKRLAELKKAHPADPSVATLEGDVAMASQSYEAAADAYVAAAKLAPSGAAAIKVYRARLRGGLPDATAPLESWLQKQPADIGSRLALAEAYAAAGQRDRAIEQYELVVRSERPNAMALNNLAWLYHENGDKRAIEVARRANGAAPDVAAIADTYGWILVNEGNLSEGLPILRKAAADPSAQPDIRYHYAVALVRAGQRDEARKELQQILSGEARFASAAEARKLLQQLGES